MDPSLNIGFSNYLEFCFEWGLLMFDMKLMPFWHHIIFHTLDLGPSVIPLGSKMLLSVWGASILEFFLVLSSCVNSTLNCLHVQSRIWCTTLNALKSSHKGGGGFYFIFYMFSRPFFKAIAKGLSHTIQTYPYVNIHGFLFAPCQ